MALESGNYIDNLVATNPPGTDPKSQGDDHLRLIKTALKNCFTGFTGAVVVTGTDGGAVNAYTLTTTPALIGYTTRMIAVFSPTIQNTGAATINISGLGTRPIVTVAGTPVVSGDLAVGTIYAAAYDGASFRLLQITKNYADQLAFGASLPAQAGNADKFITTNGTVASWSDLIKVGTMKFADSADTTKRVQYDLSGLTTGQTRIAVWPDRDTYIGNDLIYSSRSANTILAPADNGSWIDITANTFTQTFTAAATLKRGWWCVFRNRGTGVITLDPNAAELIDGAATVRVPSGHAVIISCTGTGFVCQRIGQPVIEVLTSGTSWTPPAGVYTVSLLEEVGAGGGGARSAGASPGPGGGSGALLRKTNIPVNPATSYVYAIGVGGVSQTVNGTNGNNGGSTTFTANAVTYTAGGGLGGDLANARGPGGTATNGDLNITGSYGWNISGSNVTATGGSLLGGMRFSNGNDTAAGADYGSGGGGTAAGTNSGQGANGVLELTY